MLKKNTTYSSIYFSGSGFLLSYHYGVVKALKDNNINFENAYGVSGGVHSATCILHMSDLELGIRQLFDLKYLFNTQPNFYKNYRKFVNILYQNTNFNDHIHIGIYDFFKKRKKWINSFESLYEFREFILLSSLIPVLIRFFPYFYKGRLYIDAMSILTSNYVVAVSPCNLMNGPSALVKLEGNYKRYQHFFCNETLMCEAFISGYRHTLSQIEEPITCDIKSWFKCTMLKHKNWKKSHNIKTSLVSYGNILIFIALLYLLVILIKVLNLNKLIQVNIFI